MPPLSVPKKHFQTLDAFRGICACLVALFHFKANSIFHGISIFENASVYVDFFFVLSGFVIFANYEDRLKEGYSKTKFILLRFGRLWPLHISIFIAFILVDCIQLLIDTSDLSDYRPFSAPGEGMDAIIANIFMVHSLGILDQLSFNGPSWSISVEFYTYILFALILSLFPKHSLKIIVACAIISLCTLLYFYGPSLYAKYDYGIFRCIYGFSFGAITWTLYKHTHQKISIIAQKSILINMLEVILLLSIGICIHFLYHGIGSFLFPFIFSFILLVFAHEGGVISTLLKWRPFQIIGVLSYSIYMIHIFIYGKFFELPIRLIEMKTDISLTIITQTGKKLYGSNIIAGTGIEILYLIIVIVLSYISYKLIEEPARELTRRYAKKKW